MNPYLAQFSLENKTALVTGGNRGLGLSLTKALLGAGANVAIVHRTGNTAEAQAAATECGKELIIMQADLAQPDSREGLVQHVAEQLGGLDILVNNAGITHRAPAINFPIEQWREVIEVNLTAVFDLSQQAARIMWDRGGRIINIASVLSYLAGWTIPAYTAAKSGLAGLTRSFANEWAAQNITVNAIAPGYFATDVTQPLQDDPKRNAEILAHVPMGRWGKPDELSGALILLASDAGRFMTGSMLTVDGGYLVR